MPKLKFFILFPLFSLFSLLSLLFTPFSLLAAEEAVVTATVTPELVSVVLSDTSPSTVGYGALNLGTSDAAPVSPTNDPTLTFVNNGTVEEDFYARGADATATGSNWTLVNSQGVDAYVHKIRTPTNVFTLTKVSPYPLLVNVLAPNGVIDTHLWLSMPTGITGSYVQHSTTVTVIATKHT